MIVKAAWLGIFSFLIPSIFCQVSPSEGIPSKTNKVCPISGKAIPPLYRGEGWKDNDKDGFLDNQVLHEGKKISFCCPKCIKTYWSRESLKTKELRLIRVENRERGPRTTIELSQRLKGLKEDALVLNEKLRGVKSLRKEKEVQDALLLQIEEQSQLIHKLTLELEKQASLNAPLEK